MHSAMAKVKTVSRSITLFTYVYLFTVADLHKKREKKTAEQSHQRSIQPFRFFSLILE